MKIKNIKIFNTINKLKNNNKLNKSGLDQNHTWYYCSFTDDDNVQKEEWFYEETRKISFSDYYYDSYYKMLISKNEDYRSAVSINAECSVKYVELVPIYRTNGNFLYEIEDNNCQINKIYKLIK